MFKRYEITLLAVFASIFTGIYLYVEGLISRYISVSIFLLGVSIFLFIIIKGNNFQKSQGILEYIEV